MLLAGLLLAPAARAAITVNASFEPARAAIGDRVQYRIEVTESGESGAPSPQQISRIESPSVAGLRLVNGRQSTRQNIQMGGGGASFETTVSLVFDALPAGPGTYRVPPFQLSYKNERLTVPEAVLEVFENPDEVPPPVSDLVFLEVGLPDSVYVGQSVAVTLTLYVDETVNLQQLGSPQIQGDAFHLGELPEEARQGRETRGSRRFTTYNWTLRATPLSSGPETVAFEVEMIGVVPEAFAGRPARRQLGRGLLSDLFVRPQRFTVYSDETRIEVKPLPEAGKPASFGGAIGSFSMETEPPSAVAEVGEPLILEARISGSGNFDRIRPPQLEGGDAWKIYDPDSRFEPSDRIGLSGTLTLSYVLIPQQSGERELPPLRFSFLEPESGKFVELSGQPATVAVAGNGGQTALAANRNAVAGGDGPATQRSPFERLLRIDPRKVSGRSPGPAMLFSPAFVSLQVLLAAGLGVAAWRLRHRRRLASDQAYAARHATRRRLKAALAEVEQATAAGDAAALAAAAQEAVRASAELRCGRSLRSATAGELRSAVAGLPADADHALRDLFEQGDAHRFGGPERTGALSAPELRARLDTILKALR